MRPFKFLLGSRRLTFPLGRSADVMNICMTHSIVYEVVSSEKESLVLELRLPASKFLERKCNEIGI